MSGLRPFLPRPLPLHTGVSATFSFSSLRLPSPCVLVSSPSSLHPPRPIPPLCSSLPPRWTALFFYLVVASKPGSSAVWHVFCQCIPRSSSRNSSWYPGTVRTSEKITDPSSLFSVPIRLHRPRSSIISSNISRLIITRYRNRCIWLGSTGYPSFSSAVCWISKFTFRCCFIYRVVPDLFAKRSRHVLRAKYYTGY